MRTNIARYTFFLNSVAQIKPISCDIARQADYATCRSAQLSRSIFIALIITFALRAVICMAAPKIGFKVVRFFAQPYRQKI